MKRKKGDLPGRYVAPYIRKRTDRPGEYANVSGYQERVERAPSPVESVLPQGELNLRLIAKPGCQAERGSKRGQTMPHARRDASKLKKLPNPIDRHVGSRVRMRRMMLKMTQTTLAGALGITFQQVQKYEKGTNRISASRLQQISHILQVPVPFFFDGAPHVAAEPISIGRLPPHEELTDFMATRDGLALAKAFMRIRRVDLRRRIVDLVEQIEQTRST